MDLPPHLTGEDRLIAVARAFDARTYVNASGGRALYDPRRFEEAGMALRFLPAHEGSSASILSRLLAGPAETVAAEIHRDTRLLP